MTNTRRITANRTVVGIVIALLLTLVPLHPQKASAEEWWPMQYSACPNGQIVQIRFYVYEPGVKVGYGATSALASRSYFVEFKSKGWATLNVGREWMYWQVWQSPGDIGSWSKECVRMAP